MKKNKKLALDELFNQIEEQKILQKLPKGKLLINAVADSTKVKTNLLYDLFGKRRRERVVHEFLANFLENTNFKTPGKVS